MPLASLIEIFNIGDQVRPPRFTYCEEFLNPFDVSDALSTGVYQCIRLYDPTTFLFFWGLSRGIFVGRDTYLILRC